MFVVHDVVEDILGGGNLALLYVYKGWSKAIVMVSFIVILGITYPLCGYILALAAH